MQSNYSFLGTRITLLLKDEVAAAFNRAQDAFFAAQKLYIAQTGLKWTGAEALEINWTDEEQKAFDDIGRIINLLVEVNGGTLEVGEENMTSDYLVKL